MLIREVMSVKDQGQIYSVAPDTSIVEAVKQLVGHGVGSLVVMQGETLMGFITERHIVRGMAERGCSLTDAKVSDLMEQEPLVATLDDTVDYARDAMTKSHTAHLLILEGSRLVGVMSFHDVARAAVKEANFENALLKRYIKHWPE